MAVTTNLPADEQSEILEDRSIDIDSQWPPWVAICGGFGVLLSVYFRNSTPSFQFRLDEPEHTRDISLHIDQDCGAYDFFERIYKTYQKNLNS